MLKNYYFLFCLLLGSSLWAQSPFSSDRPGQSYSALSLDRHEMQIQQGFQWQDFREGNFVSQRYLSSFTEFRYGIGQGLEAGLAYGFDYFNQPLLDDEYVFNSGQPWLMLRYSFSKAEDPLQWGFLLRSNFDAYDLRGNAALALGPWSLSANLGIYSDRAIDYTVQWTLNLAYAWEKWSSFVEVYGLSLNSANSDYLAFDGGFAYMLSPRFQWEIFAGNQIGVGPAVGIYNTYFVNTGFTWRIR